MYSAPHYPYANIMAQANYMPQVDYVRPMQVDYAAPPPPPPPPSPQAENAMDFTSPPPPSQADYAMDYTVQNNGKIEPINQGKCDTSELESDIELMITRTGKLFIEKENVAPDSFKNIKYLYASLKGLKKKNELYNETSREGISNFEFLRYIHQSVYFDILHMEMTQYPALTPQQYKLRAKTKLSRTILKDCLFAALCEGGFIANRIDVDLYVNAYIDFPPMNSIYYYDKNNIYMKMKTNNNSIFKLLKADHLD